MPAPTADLGRAELQEKFFNCVGDQLDAKAKSGAFDQLMNLERRDGAADLLSLQ